MSPSRQTIPLIQCHYLETKACVHQEITEEDAVHIRTKQSLLDVSIAAHPGCAPTKAVGL